MDILKAFTGRFYYSDCKMWKYAVEKNSMLKNVEFRPHYFLFDKFLESSKIMRNIHVFQ